jgi:hypothetical protein
LVLIPATATRLTGVDSQRSVAEKTGYEIVWLKALSVEMESEGFGVHSILTTSPT